MKILMLCDLPPALLERDQRDLWGQRFLPTPVLNLLEGLVRATDVEPVVLSFDRRAAAEGTLWHRISARILRVRPGTGLSSLYLTRVPAVWRAVRELRPDVVHGQGVEAGYAWLATLQPRPSIVTLHGVYGVTVPLGRTDPFGLKGPWPRLGQALQRATLARAQHLIAISDFIAEWASRASRARVYRVPNAVHREFYRLAPAHEPEFDILYLGRITPQKRIRDAIQVLHILERAGLTLTMGVVGRAVDRRYLDACRAHAASLRRSTVTFVGPVAAAQVIQRARVLLLPSRGESFSMVAAEASAAAVPVVGYEVGGLPSVVASGETGLLVPAGNVQALADATAAVLTNETLRRRMGEAARERALAWHQDRVAELTARVYEQVLRGGQATEQACAPDHEGTA